MAQNFRCDGCGASVDEPKILGLIIKRDYCQECAERANVFLETQEFLRKESFDKFTSDRLALVTRFSENNFKLPDVGYE